MKIKLSELRRLNFIEKVILHCHDQSLYLVSVQMDKEERYVTDERGSFLKSFNKLSLQSKFKDMTVGEMVLRHQSPYDCLLYTSPSPRDVEESRMPSSA